MEAGFQARHKHQKKQTHRIEQDNRLIPRHKTESVRVYHHIRQDSTNNPSKSQPLKQLDFFWSIAQLYHGGRDTDSTVSHRGEMT
ncbi:MAG TPA: hypothetical protein V6C93_00175 [Allocoleopsis sp.]